MMSDRLKRDLLNSAILLIGLNVMTIVAMEASQAVLASPSFPNNKKCQAATMADPTFYDCVVRDTDCVPNPAYDPEDPAKCGNLQAGVWTAGNCYDAVTYHCPTAVSSKHSTTVYNSYCQQNTTTPCQCILVPLAAKNNVDKDVVDCNY
jgi:hypothetical protein